MRHVDRKVSGGAAARRGDLISFQFAAALSEGDLDARRFVEERDEHHPIEATLDEESLLAALVDGLVGMRAGGSQRRIFLSADEAFGWRGLDNRVPPGAELVFDVCLRSVVRLGDD
jgi:FKBP-type peptidyl-prolyl cis-trans isomerase